MKNTFKCLGIVAIFAIIILTLSGCGSNENILKVVNQNDNPITAVQLLIPQHSGGYATLQNWDNLNIAKGNSKNFSVDHHDWAGVSVYVNGNWRQTSTDVNFHTARQRGGITITVTLNNTGSLSH